MKIVVNDIAASEGGALTVLQNFYEEIRSSNDRNEWIFLLNDDYIEETDNIKIKLFSEVKNSWFKRLYFELFQGKKIVNQLDPDIYFSLQNTATLGIKAEQIVYLHQSLPYQKEKSFSFFRKDEWKLAVYQKIIGRLYEYLFKQTKAKIIVQTEWMKKAVKKRISNKIVVVPPHIKIPDKLSNKKRENKKVTFFYPASDSLYKNHEVIYAAVNHIVKRGYTNFQVVLTISPKNVMNQNIYDFIGQVSRDEVFEYYSNSILLFPSYIETYGLPLKEASLLNVPIIASKTDFSTEVLRGYDRVNFFNKFESMELAGIMISYIANDNKMNNENTEKHLKQTQGNGLLDVITSGK
ncbi:glycosyltransferase [Tetragenococcus koreensis]|uniref:Glycosyl transferase family 1 domain-containing protein n=1 Tax=Tetragenococcus koreensis TaxID=290335 RepID=A0AAN4RLW2_9ENTE|nr:glycosyltransferase [Tetragenococcus koreensis]MDN6834590.1 glycosyltransferase [Lactococcus lactis]GEQ49544.1 hypothetical protein TK11N_13960 [Tetragenococcus koreensis]GEQ51990.1 hypothetical protein TK12N_13340 [Tetragenococcus koreensis]GEQ54525.1 hypothetical protein TK2N_13690 [Tetragenococcus koreensis]GEQ56992.1 hypothetical protein TK4N_13350 [Tetragenococcus koreensis]